MRYRMKNALTGSIMEVDESRVDEYVSRGHVLLDKPEEPKEEPKPVEEAKPKKRGSKK